MPYFACKKEKEIQAHIRTLTLYMLIIKCLAVNHFKSWLYCFYYCVRITRNWKIISAAEKPKQKQNQSKTHGYVYRLDCAIIVYTYSENFENGLWMHEFYGAILCILRLKIDIIHFWNNMIYSIELLLICFYFFHHLIGLTNSTKYKQ